MPNPGPQTQALKTQADELFYGGAAGGGKSDLLLGLAGTEHWASVILRREQPLLRDLIERSRRIYNSQGDKHDKDRFNENLKRWALVDGRLVEFGAMQHEHDKEKWRGRPHDFYGFDEITQFTESQYRFVKMWLRSVRAGQRCRVVATGNPPTSVEGQWVIRYWAPWLDSHHPNPARPGELRWFANVGGEEKEVAGPEPFDNVNSKNGQKERVTPRSRTFIPARLDDNPILASTNYLSELQAAPEPLRTQMIYGDMNVGRSDDAWQVIPSDWLKAAVARWRKDGGDGVTMDAVGADVAYGGADRTCIVRRHGIWFAMPVKYEGKQAGAADVGEGDAAARLILKEHTFGARINVDAIGYGAAAYEALKRYTHVVKSSWIDPVNVGGGTNLMDSSRRFAFVNIRAAMYWMLREALDPLTGDNIALPPDRDLETELCSTRYEVKPAGIKIEDKDDIKDRIGRSPDVADALCLANWGRKGGLSVPDPKMLEQIAKDFAENVVEKSPFGSEATTDMGEDVADEGGSSNWHRRDPMRRRGGF